MECRGNRWGQSRYPMGNWKRNVCRYDRAYTQKVEEKEHIDIGSLRSGRDAICDVNEDELTPEQLEDFKKTRKNGKDIISKRCDFQLQDKPLLLIYRIKKDGGIPKTKNRFKMDSIADIVGISIIVSGDSIGETHAKSLRIMI